MIAPKKKNSKNPRWPLKKKNVYTNILDSPFLNSQKAHLRPCKKKILKNPCLSFLKLHKKFTPSHDPFDLSEKNIKNPFL